jgi:predicted nucleic acid-binding protein
MIGLDCNILIQLAFADHPANLKTLLKVQFEISRGEKLALVPLAVAEFLHVATDDRRFAPPLTMIEALDWIEEFLKNPSVSLLEATPASMEQTLRWMKQLNLGRKRILDTQLAAVLHNGCVRRLLTSNPADFKIFGVLEMVTP